MASWHWDLKGLSRTYTPGNGPTSVVHAAAYQSGQRLHDERRDEVRDFTRKEGVNFECILAPADAPSWVYDRSQLWNHVERQERRRDALLARRLVMSLPKELTLDQQIKLVTDYLGTHFVAHGVVCDFAIHEANGHNPHVHVLIAKRILRDGEFRELDTRLNVFAKENTKRAKGRGVFVEALRADWARSQNLVLQRLGFDARVDHRSFVRQGRNLEPYGGRALVLHAMEVERSGACNAPEALRAARAEQFREDPDTAVDLATQKTGPFTRAAFEEFLAYHVPADQVAGVYQHILSERALKRVGRTDDGEPLYASERFVQRRKLGRLYARNPAKALEHFMAERSQAVFRRADLEEWLLHAVTSDNFDAAMRSIMRSHHLILLGGDQAGDLHYTSRAYLAVERQMLRDARALGLAHKNRVCPELVDAVSHKHGLYLEQELAYRYLVEHSSHLAVVEGLAGTGKSYLLGAAREAWERAGYRVKGAALSGKATKGLAEQSGIHARTLASWEFGWSMGVHRLTPKDIFVIDEAGMIGTAQLARLVRRVRKAGAKIVVVGDRRQLQPLEAGQPFALLGERYGSVSLTNVMRQREPWMRMASRLMGLGDVATGLHAYREHGCVVDGASVDSLVERWTALRETTAVDDLLMLAYSNASVCQANDLAQNARVERGELGDLAVPFLYRWSDRNGEEQTHEFALRAGDRFMAMQTDRGLGLDNGALGTVLEVSPIALTVRLDSGVVTTFDPRSYERFALGYCATVHRAQGATVDRVLVYGSPAFDAHATYVAMTRHRVSVELHLPPKLQLEALCEEAPAHSAVNFAIPEVRDRPAYEFGSLRSGVPGEALRAKHRQLSDADLAERINALHGEAERLTPRPEDYVVASRAALSAQRALESAAYEQDGRPRLSFDPARRVQLLRAASEPWSRARLWRRGRLEAQSASERISELRSELAFAREVQRERQILRAEQQMLDELRRDKPQWRRTAVRLAELHVKQATGHAPRLSEEARRALGVPERIEVVEKWLAFAAERPEEAQAARLYADDDRYLQMMAQLPRAGRQRSGPQREQGSGVGRWHRRLDELEARLAQVVMERVNNPKLSQDDYWRFLDMERKLSQDVFRARNRLERSLGLSAARVAGEPGERGLAELERARNVAAVAFAQGANNWERAKLSLTEEEVHRVRSATSDASPEASKIYQAYRRTHLVYRNLKKAYARALRLHRAHQL